MNFRVSNIVLAMGIIIIIFTSIFVLASNYKTPDVKGNNSTGNFQKQVNNFTELYEQVVPPRGTSFPGKWDNIGPRLITSGAIDLEKFKRSYERTRPLTEEQITFFTEGSNETIKITPENANFILNTLWALGLVNKNNILSQGPMGQYAGQAGNFASTGGWTLGTRAGGKLLNSAEIIELMPEQQAIVERIAGKSYRPCCDNPTSFPDCNHGAAALGLIELLASQGATEEQIIEAVKAANSMWFSQQYLELAIYFKVTEGKDWDDVDPWLIMSKKYSSRSGWADMHRKLEEMDALPKASGKGLSCSV